MNQYQNLVSKDEYSMQEFMGGIEDMVKEFVQTYHCIGDEQKSMFGGSTQDIFGKCPKCGMNVSRAMGVALTDSQIKSMLEGKRSS